ncbi:MAG: hypothetical protein LKCHEGNO_03264 [Burkholderiaceae bacterium]|nr:hypothetical protein [Burkholderiaceae bacterium]
MTPIATILVATDFSASGNNAVGRAALLARQLGARLTLLHVVNPAGPRRRRWFSRPIAVALEAARAQAVLTRLRIDIAGPLGVAASVDVRVGDARDELLAAARHADLLVVGQRRTHRLLALATAGTAARAMQAGRTPVLVVKRKVEGPYRQALVPVNFSAHAEAAVQTAASLAPEWGVQVFHAIDTLHETVLRESDATQAILRNARARQEAHVHARMRRSVARLGLEARRMSFALAHGAPVRSTLWQLRASAADLVVAGKQSRWAIGGLALGSVSRRLLARADCDIVIVPHATRASAPLRASPFARAQLRTEQH